MKPTPFQPKVSPAILATSKKEFDEKWAYIATIRPRPSLVQIDVADGKFVPNTTWITPARLAAMNPKETVEVHCMTVNPEKSAHAWKKAGATQIVFHYEATPNPEATIQNIKKAGVRVIMAVNPSTTLSKIYPLCTRVDGVLVMGVEPGFSGQKAYPGLTRRVKTLRARFPHLRIEVDGGVTPKNAPSLREAGADVVFSGSAYFL